MGNTTTKIQRKIEALITQNYCHLATNELLFNYHYTIGKINYESSQTQNSVTLSAVYRADRLSFNSAAVV